MVLEEHSADEMYGMTGKPTVGRLKIYDLSMVRSPPLLTAIAPKYRPRLFATSVPLCMSYHTCVGISGETAFLLLVRFASMIACRKS